MLHRKTDKHKTKTPIKTKQYQLTKNHQHTNKTHINKNYTNITHNKSQTINKDKTKLSKPNS